MSNFHSKTKRVEAVLYEGDLKPIKQFMDIDDAGYDIDNRDFVIPMEKAAFGTAIVLHKGYYAVKTDDGKFYAQDAASFENEWELDEEDGVSENQNPESHE